MIEQLPTDAEFIADIRSFLHKVKSVFVFLFSWRLIQGNIQRFRSRRRPFVLEFVVIVLLLVFGLFAGSTNFLYKMFPAFCVCLAFTFFGSSNRRRRIVMLLVNGILFVGLWFILVKTLVVFMFVSFNGHFQYLNANRYECWLAGGKMLTPSYQSGDTLTYECVIADSRKCADEGGHLGSRGIFSEDVCYYP